MEWTRSETIGLASASCVFCRGLGLRTLQASSSKPCGCVFRAIFRTVYDRYTLSLQRCGWSSGVTLDHVQGPKGFRTWSRRNEEFIADFILLAKRSLTPEEHRIFEFRFLERGDWKSAVQTLGIEKGVFFHMVYVIQEKLGKVFSETEPHSIYPVDEYFNSIKPETRAKKAEPVVVFAKPESKVVRMPVRPDGNKVSKRFPIQDAPRKVA
jgi:hypothetical protein